MAKITALTFVVPVRDLEKAVRAYAEAFGFRGGLSRREQRLRCHSANGQCAWAAPGRNSVWPNPWRNSQQGPFWAML